MCGICGIFDRSGRRPDGALLVRMTTSRIAGPTAKALRARGRRSAIGASASSTSTAARSRSPTRTARSRSSSTARSTTSSSCARSSKGSAIAFKTRSDTEVIVHAYEQWGERLRQPTSTACSRSRSGTRRDARAVPGPGPPGHQAALLRRRSAAQLLFASEIKALLQDPRLSARSRPRGARRAVHVPLRAFAEDAVQGRSASCRRATG